MKTKTERKDEGEYNYADKGYKRRSKKKEPDIPTP